MNKMFGKKYGNGKHNLFILEANLYNNEKPYYEITPLRDSDIKRCVIFGGKFSKNINYPKDGLGVTCLYLETEKEINENNYFNNVQRLLNLVWLATGSPIDYQIEEIEGYDNFESIYNDYKCDMFYNPNIIHGLISDKSPINRVVAYSLLIQKLSTEDFEKFDNALYTYTLAQEIERLPDPHLKYTLYMMLYLSSIEQLANLNQTICNANIVCEKCGKKVGSKHETTRTYEIKKLIEELLEKDVEKISSLITRLYGKLRSGFLHRGTLRGSEKKGGFLFGVSSEEGKKLVEEMANIKLINRNLLELFLFKRQK